MAKCVVVGGGFAGLSAAVNLCSKGHSVRLLEASPKLGGRAYSLRYDKQDDVIDNGQHILMGCYKYTLEFLKKIDSIQFLEFQKNLSTVFVDAAGKEYKLDASGLFYPLNLLKAIFYYKAISFKERFGIASLFARIFVSSPERYSDLTTESFLRKYGQSSNAVNSFWEIIHVGTMNCKLSESSAEIFVDILKKMFLSGNKAATILLPKVGLSELYCHNAEKYINNNGGEIFLSRKVITLNTGSANRIASITTSKGEVGDFDYVVLAVSPFNVKELLTGVKLADIVPEFEYSSIMTCHIWLSKNPFAEKFYGLIGSKIHWLFNHGKHISLITSAADGLLESANDELLSEFVGELENYFPAFSGKLVTGYKIIKEKRSTFIADKNIISSRKLLNLKYGNLLLSGDWTNTALPSTIEGAVKSGKVAADKILI